MRMFGGDLSSEEQRRMVINAYSRLKDTFEGLVKPDGTKNLPAKTCRDLFQAHPDKPSGEVGRGQGIFYPTFISQSLVSKACLRIS
jgi:hypothetical protein